MLLKKELEKLNGLIGKEDKVFNEQLVAVKKCVHTDADKKMLSDYLSNLFASTIAESEKSKEEITIKMQLEKISEILSLSYIAKHYFNKTRGWLHQRISGAIVNNKPAKFTEDEVKVFNRALKDVCKIIGSTKVSLP